MKAIIKSVKHLRGGKAVRKLLTLPKMEAIFLGVNNSLVRSCFKSLDIVVIFSEGTSKWPVCKFKRKPKW